MKAPSVVVKSDDETRADTCERCGGEVLLFPRPFYRSPARFDGIARVVHLEAQGQPSGSATAHRLHSDVCKGARS